MRLVAVCEAAADFRVVVGVVDRILGAEAPQWARDLMEHSPDGVRGWESDGEGRPFFDLHRLTAYMRARSVRATHGHFDGKPAAVGALVARNTLDLMRAVAKSKPVDAVILVWDMDDQPVERRAGLAQGRDEARGLGLPFRIVLGCANAEREAWVIAGFEPANDDEHARLRDLRAELGFHVNQESHRLSSKRNDVKRSTKRVLDILVDGDRDREARCWTTTSLETLRARGVGCGLADFLDELREHILPLC